MDNTQLQEQIIALKNSLESLQQEYYRNNFKGRQDFNKYSNFTTMVKLPHYDSVPSTCEVGEIIENSGKLLICSATDTWTIVGTQS